MNAKRLFILVNGTLTISSLMLLAAFLYWRTPPASACHVTVERLDELMSPPSLNPTASERSI